MKDIWTQDFVYLKFQKVVTDEQIYHLSIVKDVCVYQEK